MNYFTTRFEKLVTEIEKKLQVPWVLSEGCCNLEIQNSELATYDWQRLGVDGSATSPEEAQVLVVAGWINESRAQELKDVYEQMQKPTTVIAVGSCALSGSPYRIAGEKVIRCADILNVDVFVPGCPPRPEAILSAVLELQKKLSPGPTSREVLSAALK
jgi:NADH-quinone oxidoreductase subunit B